MSIIAFSILVFSSFAEFDCFYKLASFLVLLFFIFFFIVGKSSYRYLRSDLRPLTYFYSYELTTTDGGGGDNLVTIIGGHFIAEVPIDTIS